jgi:hypothetical protein
VGSTLKLLDLTMRCNPSGTYGNERGYYFKCLLTAFVI